MSKTIAIDGHKNEAVFSGPSYGGYVTADDEVVLTVYMVHLPSHNDDCGDACDFYYSMREFQLYI